MISKPTATCPRCNEKFTMLDAVDVSRHAETVTYYAECSCGAANITVSRGQITGITPREPIEIPEYRDEPLGSQDDPDYMAI